MKSIGLLLSFLFCGLPVFGEPLDPCKELHAGLAANPDASSSGFQSWWKKKGYDPQCVPWLQTACHSSFQLDNPSFQGKFIPDSHRGNLSFLMSEIYGGSCQKWQNLLDQGNFAELQRIMGQLPAAEQEARLNADQRKLVLQGLKYWQLINDKRDHDLTAITKRFDDLQSRGAKDAKKITSFRAGDAIDGMLSHVERALRSEPAKERAISLDYINGNLENARASMLDLLRKNPDGRKNYDLLVSRAQMVHIDERSQEYGTLSPYHAKMILLYRLEDAYRETFRLEYDASKDPKNDRDAWVNARTEQEMSGLLKEMKIYTVYGPVKGEAPSLWARSIPHDGFLFSSYPDQTYEMLDHPRRMSRKGQAATYGAGLDCTTFLQMTVGAVYGDKYANLSTDQRLNSFKIFNSWNKLALKDVAKPYTLKATGNEAGTVRPADILPGDALVAGTPGGDPNDYGHGTLVLGYLNNPGPPGLAILSMRGGYNRSILLEKVYPYRNSPYRCDQVYLYGDPNTSYKVIKFGNQGRR